MYSLPLHMHNPPTINIPHQSGTWLTVDEPALTHFYHLESTVQCLLLVLHILNLNKCIVACTYHCSTIKSSFTALKTFCVSYLFVLPSPNPWKQPKPSIYLFIYFQCLHSFAFSRMSDSWNYTGCSLCRLASFTQKHAFKVFHIFLLLDGSLLLKE